MTGVQTCALPICFPVTISGRIDLSGWGKEARLEASNYAKARAIGEAEILPAVIIKARGKKIADSYLVFRLGDLFGE